MSSEELKVCKYCASEISKKAIICPKCQKEQRSFMKKHPIISFVLILVVLINAIQSIISASDPNALSATSQVKQEEAPTPISAMDLYAVYKQNEIQGDQLLKGKILEISGTVDSIGKDVLDNPYVSLEAGQFAFTVQCMLKDSSKASELRKGDKIVVIGRNAGKLGNVIVRDCYIK